MLTSFASTIGFNAGHCLAETVYLISTLVFYRGNFRALIAGGGTGAVTVHLAEQLNHTKITELVHLDFSFTSTHVAQLRAKIRHLKNVVYINGNIESIPYLNCLPFDYIQCSGVLHHLKIPTLGLNVLKEVLKHNGGMSLMLYSTYDRTGIYQLQKLMKDVNTNDINGIMNKEIKNALAILRDIPPSNWLRKMMT